MRRRQCAGLQHAHAFFQAPHLRKLVHRWAAQIVQPAALQEAMMVQWLPIDGRAGCKRVHMTKFLQRQVHCSKLIWTMLALVSKVPRIADTRVVYYANPLLMFVESRR